MNSSLPRILIIDDEALNIEILLGMLEGEGYRLDVARDGVEAWERLEGDPDAFDAVLLDRMMPRMDGMEVLRRVKNHDQLRHIPIILQTAMDSRQNFVEGIRAGAFYYLVKPYDGEVLVSVVRTAVRDSQQYKSIRESMRETTRTLGLMHGGSFRFRTLAEARALATLLAGACPNPDGVAMGLAELMINAVEHGNLGITYAEKSALNEAGRWEAEVEHRLLLEGLSSRRVEVEFTREADAIRITITDQGPGFDWDNYLTLSPERALDNHGRGNQVAVTILLAQDNRH